jgi:hypothetical protein
MYRLNSFESGYELVVDCCEHGNEPHGSIKSEDLLCLFSVVSRPFHMYIPKQGI